MLFRKDDVETNCLYKILVMIMCTLIYNLNYVSFD